MSSRVGKDHFFQTRNLLIQAIAVNKTDGDFRRASGRSLTKGFRIIAQCLEDYNVWYVVSDHHPQGAKSLLAIIFNIIEELNLKGFYYNKSDNTIMFDLKQIHPQNERIPNLIRLGS